VRPVRTVPLHGAKARGRFAFVSERRYDLAMAYRWRVWERQLPSGTIVGPYAIAHVQRADGRWTTIKLHQLIMGCAGVDHRNHYGLDNTDPNLRKATSAQNNRHTRPRTGTTSRFTGVARYRNGKWKAYIRVDGKQHHLGYFTVEEDAARRYNVAALEEFGEFAYLNPVGG
jgi:hypothetical protein